jgi:hypothetical protein
MRPVSKAGDAPTTTRISVEEAIDRFLKLEERDEWIERLTDEQRDLLQFYIVERRPCTAGLKKRAERAFLLREKMGQQRREGERWLRTHVHIEWADETRTTGWDDVDSVHRTKVTQAGTVSLAELEQALQRRFGKPDDTRTRTEILDAYFLEAVTAGGHPSQAEAMKTITGAGKTWSRKEFRAAFNEMARKHGIPTGRGIRRR